MLRVVGGREISKAGIYTHFKYFVEGLCRNIAKAACQKQGWQAQLQKGRLIEIVGEFVPQEKHQ